MSKTPRVLSGTMGGDVMVPPPKRVLRKIAHKIEVHQRKLKEHQRKENRRVRMKSAFDKSEPKG